MLHIKRGYSYKTKLLAQGFKCPIINYVVSILKIDSYRYSLNYKVLLHVSAVYHLSMVEILYVKNVNPGTTYVRLIGLTLDLYN